MDNDSWKDEIRNKLICIYSKNKEQEEDLLRILWLLDEEELAYQEHETVSPMWRTLRSALVSDSVFRKYADKMATDTKSVEKNPNFRKVMRNMYEKMMDADDNELPGDFGFDLVRIGDEKTALSGISSGIARAWELLPLSSKGEMLELVRKLAQNYKALSVVDEVVGLANKAGGNAVMIGLAAVSLSYQCIINIRRWYKGEITGIRCVKNCIDSLMSVAGGVGGGMGGALIGSMIMPGIGTLIGGLVGGVSVCQLSSVLSDKLTRNIFDLPKDEAVEKAYNYFGVSHRASNDEINKKFRASCLRHHPDKGGKDEDFIELQFYMSLIKTVRESGMERW